MRYDLEFRPGVRTELRQVEKWYRAREPELGIEFRTEVEQAFELLALNPLIHQVRDPKRNIRFAKLGKFPYHIVFRVQDLTVTIFTVIHTARHEREWKRRL